MSTELRNFLALSYDELEELNLQAKADRMNRDANRRDSRKAAEVPDRPEAHQGGDGSVQRSGGPAASARLRQKVPARGLRKPDLRRLVDPRVHGAERERSAPGHRLERVLLGACRCVRQRQGSGLRQRDRQGRNALRGGHARRAQGLLRQAVQGKAVHAECGDGDRRLPVCRQGRGADATTRPANSSSSAPAATITRCRSIRCASSSILRRKCSARWDSRTKRTTPRLRQASSRSTTATPRW